MYPARIAVTIASFVFLPSFLHILYVIVLKRLPTMNVAVAPPITLHIHKRMPKWATEWIHSVHVDSVIRPVVSDVETARVVLLVDLLFVAKKRLLRANYSMAARSTMMLL